MPRKKGTPKTGGRKTGTPNRVSSSMKDKLKSVLETEINRLPGLLEELAPDERAGLLAKLLPFVMPRQSEVNIQSEIDALLLGIDRLDDEQLSRLEEIITNVVANGEFRTA